MSKEFAPFEALQRRAALGPAARVHHRALERRVEHVKLVVLCGRELLQLMVPAGPALIVEMLERTACQLPFVGNHSAGTLKRAV